MQVNGINQTNFRAKISPELETCARNFYNSGENRLKSAYKLSEKIKEFNNFGYDDYTVKFAKEYVGYGTEYSLYAINENESKGKKVVLAKRGCFRHLINVFMKMKKGEFISKFRK